MNKKTRWFVAIGLLLSVTSGVVQAAVCTSVSAGRWDSSARWSCGHIPVAADTVVINHNNVQMRGNYSVAGVTINTGAVLDDNGNDLTVQGNVVNNGTFGISGSGGNLFMNKVGSTLSGTGTFADARVYVDAANISIPVGSSMNFANGASIRVGSNTAGSLTISGAITDTGIQSGNRTLRVYSASTVTISGTLNIPNSYVQIRSGGTVANNGMTNLQYVDGNGAATATWTQGANANVTFTKPAVSWVGAFNASNTGNTVTYNGTATALTPNNNTYFNLAGTGVRCPHSFTILGTQPCTVTSGTVTVTADPGSCVNATGIGSVAWAPSPTTNVNLSDNLYATATVRGTSNYLKCTGYNFAIPATATILGVVVNVERKSSATSRTTDGAMRLVKAGVVGAVDRSTVTVYTKADVVEAHGTSADLWGGAWTPADVNAATFGAAFAVKTTKSRTVSVDHMPISVTYKAPEAAPHHIQIEHTGDGKTCAPEMLTIKACSDAACTSNFRTADVSGNVTWSGGTLPFSMVSGGTGQATVSLPVTSAQTVTLGTSGVTPTPLAASGCTNQAGGVACSLPFVYSTLCLDAVEVGKAVRTPIYTKLAGTAFSLDVRNVSGANYSGTVKVELVDAAAGSCASLPQLHTQNVGFSNQVVKTVNFNYTNAARNAKVRMTGTGTPSCSSDAFVIRPISFVVTAPTANADAAGLSSTATPTVVAGGSFSLDATAVAGYDGTPTIDNALIVPHSVAVVPGLMGGAFGAANVTTGVATGNTFTYGEVGYFKLDVNAVNDQTFANLDAMEATPECTLDYSNTMDGSGKYGCYIGHAATAYFGRFIPDHFDTVVTDECDTFTYSGQAFPLEVQAKDAAGTTLQNYEGAFAKSITLSDGLNASTLGTFTPNTLANTSFLLGAATATPAYRFANIKTSETAISVRAVESVGGDGVSSATAATPTEGEALIRSGRVWIGNAYGSELLDMSVPVYAQYWNGSVYVNNVDDHVATCTSFAKPTAINVVRGGSTVGTTTPNMPYVDAAIAGNVGFSSGNGALALSKPGVAGTATVTLVVPTWLQYAWDGSTLSNPSAQATFGVYKGNKAIIYLRERY